MSAADAILQPFFCCFAPEHSHSVCIPISMNIFSTICHSHSRFVGFYFVIHCRHVGMCWQKHDCYLLWFIIFCLTSLFQAPGIAPSISAIYYSKHSSFLSWDYKGILQFTSFYIMILSINSNLIQSPYSFCFIGFRWALGCTLLHSYPLVFTSYYPCLSKTNQKSLRGKGRDAWCW